MKIFVVLLGLLYLALAMWCSFAPETTSDKVGLQLKGGSGQSEFLTVYGGLEFGLAMVFLLPLLVDKATAFSLVASILIHASLVIFRTIGFVAFSGIESKTVKVAVGEWVILGLGILCAAIYRGQIKAALFD